MARNVSGVYSLPDTISNGDDGDATDLMAILNDMETDHNDVLSLDYDNTVTGDNTFQGTQTFSGTLDVTGTLALTDLTVDYVALESGLSRMVTDNGFDGMLLRAGSVYDTGDTRDEYTANEGAVTVQLDYEAATPAFYVHFAPTGTTDGAITYDGYIKGVDGQLLMNPDGVFEFPFDAPVEDFVVGDTITGTSSSETAVIKSVQGASLIVDTVSGTFTDNEQITGALQGDALANIPSGLIDVELEFFHEDNYAVKVFQGAGEDINFDPTTDYVMTADGNKVLGDNVVSNPVSEDPSAGWRIIGNTLECWGLHPSGGGTGAKTVTFPASKEFKSAPTVNLTVRQTSSPTNHYDIYFVTDVVAGSTTQFAARVRRSGNGNAQDAAFNWHAIGEWDGVS